MLHIKVAHEANAYGRAIHPLTMRPSSPELPAHQYLIPAFYQFDSLVVANVQPPEYFGVVSPYSLPGHGSAVLSKAVVEHQVRGAYHSFSFLHLQLLPFIFFTSLWY